MRRELRIGLFGIGLDTYWPQFKGLKTRLRDYVLVVANKISRPGIEVVNLGLINNPKSALEAGHKFRTTAVDLVFLHVVAEKIDKLGKLLGIETVKIC